MLDEIEALPSAERGASPTYRNMQRNAVNHRLHMRRHVVRPLRIVHPWRVFRRQPVEGRDEMAALGQALVDMQGRLAGTIAGVRYTF